MPLSDVSIQSLLTKTPVILWSADRDLRLMKPSDPRVADLFPSLPSLAAHEAALGGTGGAFVVELNRRTLDAYVEPLRDSAGVIVGVVGVAVDITERMIAERAMRISEQSYRSLVDKAPYAVFRATESGQLLQVNPTMLEMLGYGRDSEEDLLMRDLPVIFDSREQFDEFQKTLLSSSSVQGFEAEWRKRDGRVFYVRLGGRAVRRVNRDVLYFDLLAEDVTEKRELASRLEQAQKMQMIGQLAGGIAHDFNNLLTVINGYCDLLMPHASDVEMTGGLKTIRQAGERASGLTQQLLAFSRKQVTVTQPLILNSVVKEVLGLSRRLISENIHMVENLGPQTGNVLADPAQMHQMLMNLVVNARDAMPAGGALTIETYPLQLNEDQARHLDVKYGNYAVLSVSDTGFGMDEYVRAHIFEPFFTTKAAGKGTGLGLATVYALVRRSGGAVVVESSPGQGSTFKLFLPSLAGETAIEESSEPSAGLVRGYSTVLVVEDEPTVRRFTLRVLKEAGYQLLEASNGEEALKVAGGHHGPIHLLLTDMVMPGLTGTELASHLRSIHPESKVLLVSGYSEALVANDSIDEGIHYLQKPFSPDLLARTVGSIVAN